MLANIPWWGWVLLAAAALVIAPLKLRVWKSLLQKQQERNRPIEDE